MCSVNSNTHSIQISRKLRIENNFLSLRKGSYDTQIQSYHRKIITLPKIRNQGRTSSPFRVSAAVEGLSLCNRTIEINKKY